MAIGDVTHTQLDRRSGFVSDLRPCPGGTNVLVDGVGTVRVDVAPDPVAADHWLRRMRRVDMAVIDADGGATCELRGVGHRLPVRSRISLPTALGLALLHVPVLVVVPGSGRA